MGLSLANGQAASRDSHLVGSNVEQLLDFDLETLGTVDSDSTISARWFSFYQLRGKRSTAQSGHSKIARRRRGVVALFSISYPSLAT
jgi:hypothetical protein